MTRLAVNARFRRRPITGVERFAGEVTSRLAEDPAFSLEEIFPRREAAGLKGHFWEQCVLPRRIGRGAVLFSPCNTGPLAVVPQLVVIHDAAVWDCPEGFSSSFRTVYRELLPRLAKRAALVATVSEFSRRRLASRLGLPEEEILVLGNAVSEEFAPSSPDRVECGMQEGSSGAVLLCVGSMDPRKNLGRLLRAWLFLQKEGRLPEDARLRLVGGANPRNFAGIERLEGCGIEWLGRIDDAELIRHYREADAFVYPSTYEGFGLPPLEAMACGCPVLLSNAASLPEVGGPESEGAVRYFEPGSEAGIAGAIEGFFRLDELARETMRQKALERASRFSWQSIAEKTGEGLRRIAEG